MKKEFIKCFGLLAVLIAFNAHAQQTSTDGTFGTGSSTTNMSLKTGTAPGGTTHVTILGGSRLPQRHVQ